MGWLPFTPAYAETHYKFKLPTSRIFRKLPELLLDAPSQVVCGETAPLWLVARDADRFPVQLLKIEGKWQNALGESHPFTLECAQALDQPFHFVPLTLPPPPAAGLWLVHANIHYERLGKKLTCSRWNYPGLAPQPLLIHFLAHPAPTPAGWFAGETHCHTWHSSDPVEFGASPAVLQSAARALGLDFVLTTDHSYDFAWEQARFMSPADPTERFACLLREVANLPPGPLLIPGEEVSCGNSKDQNVHLLVPGAGHYIPGQGDGGRRWFHNRPDLTISQVLEQAKVPCFAAHPQVPMGKLERAVFRRGDWAEPDLHTTGPNPIAGLQFWNGARDAGYHAGRSFWIQQLLQGKRILPIGGNDAHGDLNDCTGVRTPLWSLKHSHRHIFGKVRTVLPLSAPLSPASVLSAFRGDTLYLTEGPALWWSCPEGAPLLQARSSTDFGTLRAVRLFLGDTRQEKEIQLDLVLENSLEDAWSSPDWLHYDYLRAECETDCGLFALTSAFFTK